MTLEPFFDDFIDDAPLPIARASARPLAALMEDRFEYPDRTAFIAGDSATFGSSFAQAAFDEHRPVLIVMPDGVKFLYEPAPGLVARLRRQFRSRGAHRAGRYCSERADRHSARRSFTLSADSAGETDARYLQERSRRQTSRTPES